MVRSAALRRVSTALMTVGVLFMMGVGVWVEQYTDLWLDAERGCAPRGACADPAMVRLGWWLIVAAVAAVMIGAVVRWLALPPSSEASDSPQARSAALAGRGVPRAIALTTILAALIGAATMVVVTIVAGTDQIAVPVFCAGGILQAFTIAEIAATVRSTARSPRSAWAMGVVAAMAAVAVGIVIALGVVDVSNAFLWIVVAWAAAVTVVTAAWWMIGVNRREPSIA